MKIKLTKLLRKIINKTPRLFFRYFYYTLSDPSNKINFCVIGKLDSANPYKKLYVGKDERFKIIKKIYLSRLTIQNKLNNNTTGMVVITERSLLSKQLKDYLIVPNFIWLSIPLPITLDEYYNTLPNSPRCDIRKIKKAGFTTSISRDPNWVKSFVLNYHAPSMQKRHDEGAYIMSEGQILDLLRQEGCEFIKIYSGELCIACALTQAKGSSYNLYRLGWLKGEMNLIHSGAMAAIYWYSIKRAYELNCNEFNLGGTPAYLENGVLRFKSKWQSHFMKNNVYQINYLLLNPENPDCYNFLKTTSVIAINSKKSLILLSSKYPNQVHMRGPILEGISDWYVLRTNKVEQFNKDVEELPDSLKYWYERVPSHTFLKH